MDFNAFNALDLFVIVLLILSALRSLFRGLVHEVLSLLGWIIIIVAIRFYSPILGEMLMGWFPIEKIPAVLSAVVFLLVSLLSLQFLLIKTVKGMISVTGLSIIDRLLGGVFGVLRGIVILVLPLMFLRDLSVANEHELWQGSQCLPFLLELEALLTQWFGGSLLF